MAPTLLLILALGGGAARTAAIAQARTLAAAALQDPTCASVHEIFGVSEGSFDALDVQDGSGGFVCSTRPDTIALGEISGRRVWACAPFFRKSAAVRAATLIHEYLHTRGMRHREVEDGPEQFSSPQVTLIVLDRCAKVLR